MKDAYSFDATEEGAKQSYEQMRAAYCKIFDRIGLTYRLVAADSGAMGGSTSAEFQVLAESGEDAIVACNRCDYAANVEVAVVKAADGGSSSAEATALRPMDRVSTPTQKSIDEVSAFLKVDKKQTLKSLVYVADKDVVMAVVRGDHDVNEIRLARVLGVDEVFLATDADVTRVTGADVGFAGPAGFKGRLLVDRAASHVVNAVCGANESGYHLVNVNRGRDFEGDVVDIRLAATGDLCPNCAGGVLQSYRGIEGGHIFILGTHYSAQMDATYLDEKQQKKPIVMGCYGIGVSRLVATAIEQNHDADGIRWPVSIAPYHVHLVTVGKDDAVVAAAKSLYDALWAQGIEVLWDDRDERPGVKFKDADLLGLPFRVTIGGKSLAGGHVELKPRSEPDPKKAEMVPVGDAAARLTALVRPHL
jgi:prolyl-tRNA synthetase